MDRYPLPNDTVRAFLAHGARPGNPGLLFERFVRDLKGEKGPAKASEMKKVRDCPLDEKLLAACRTRWRRSVLAAGASIFEATTDWRLIVGLGRKGALEAGFAFHRLYGFPILPSSGLKGLARAQALLVEELDPLDPEVVAVFGRPPRTQEEGSPREEQRDEGHAGGAVFFDALPAGPPRLELDIMNPHFPGYYQGEEGPTNWQNPVPVPFLAVAPGTGFLFAVGTRGSADLGVRERALAWLKGGLRELGAGAKTAAGYGYFMVGPEEASPPGAEPPGASVDPPVASVWRRGVVHSHHSARGGVLQDAETGERLTFDTSAPQPRGTTLKGKAAVEYQMAERQGQPVVTAVRKAES